MGVTASGGSLTLPMVSVKPVLAVAPSLSVALTVMGRLPTSASWGVPDRVRVAGSKRSHAGSAVPSPVATLQVSTSPESRSSSVNASTGRT